MTAPPDPTHGHTPPDPADTVASGIGTRLAEWTIAAIEGEDPVRDDLDAASELSFRRVAAAVAALRFAAVDGTRDRPATSSADSTTRGAR